MQSGSGSSTVSHLDVSDVQRTYTLSSATVVNQNVIGGLSFAFLFTFSDPSGTSTLYLAVPFDVASKINSTYAYQTINLANTSDSAFSSLKAFGSSPSAALTSGIALSSFNFLTSLNYNQFYSVTDSTSTKVLLVSKVFLQVSSS
jgi:hypothetical protein